MPAAAVLAEDQERAAGVLVDSRFLVRAAAGRAADAEHRWALPPQ